MAALGGRTSGVKLRSGCVLEVRGLGVQGSGSRVRV